MPWRTCLVLAALVCASAARPNTGASGAAAEPGFLVVVNAGNPVRTLTSDEVSRFFLRKVSTWADGRAVAPVDQEAESETRAVFTDTILRRKLAAVRAYWQQRIFSGRDTPPPIRGSDAEVLRFVAENAGAIGYVSAQAVPDAQVRVVKVTGAAK